MVYIWEKREHRGSVSNVWKEDDASIFRLEVPPQGTHVLGDGVVNKSHVTARITAADNNVTVCTLLAIVSKAHSSNPDPILLRSNK
jgi:hypothetical protein